MKPLLSFVVAVCLLLAAHAHPENIEEVKELPQTKEPIVEAEASEPQTRTERCTTCGVGLNVKSPSNVLASLQALPGAEVHTQQSFEGCSSDKGCAGIKVKDGRVIERFGNLDAFRAAEAANAGNEFTFHTAGTLGDAPFWWMNQNSPFKNTGGSFEKFSKSSSSFTSTGSGATGAGGVGAGIGGAGFGASLDISGNPFLNGDFSKLAGGFTGAGQSGIKPGGSHQSSSFESSSFSSSSGGLNKFGPSGLGGVGAAGAAGATGFGAAQGASFGASQGAGFGTRQGAGQGAGFSTSQGAGFGTSQGAGQGAGFSTIQGAGFGTSQGAGQGAGFSTSQGAGFGTSQGAGQGAAFGEGQGAGFGTGASQSSFSSQSSFTSSGSSGNKFAGGAGYAGSSPRPFTASTAGSNVNLIQNTQKVNEFDIEQQSQQNIDEIFQGTGNVNAAEHSGGDIQQTCAGQGYVCVHKAQCNNGVVNTNGAGVLQANTKKQYCNTRTEVCCRIEVSSLAGAGSLQGSLGVGSATYSGSNQGSSLFVSQGQAGQGSGQSFAGQNAQGFGQSGQSGFQASGQSSSSSFGQRGYSGSAGQTGSTTGQAAFGAQGASNAFGASVNRGAANANSFGSTAGVYKSTSQSNFIERDSFSAGSENTGVYRPGASGTGLKPGIPYLPPDNTHVGTNIVSTAYPTTPRPVTTPRPFTIPRPVTSTAAPAYLPPQVTEQSINREVKVPIPTRPPIYTEGNLILDALLPGQRPPVSEVPGGCAAALKCTPIEYCTAEGVISTSVVALTRDQEVFRVPLTDCKLPDGGAGRLGKCCRDPTYTDPWPTNQLGQWVPGVFGGDDGKYTPDSRGSPNNLRPQVTARPPGTGSVLLSSVGPPKPTVPTFGPNQVTPGFGATVTSGQGSYNQFTQTSQGFGQKAIGGQGQIGVAGQFGRGQIESQGQGVLTSQGQGQFSQGGRGQFGVGGAVEVDRTQFTQTNQVQKTFGQTGGQRQGAFGVQGQGSFGIGQTGIQGQGATGGFGFSGVRGQFSQAVTQATQEQGQGLVQGGGVAVENEYSESVQRVFLSQYNAGSQCGLLNGQKPYGNRNDLEVDFGEIPWQAMVLLQTNKSLLCGGVITRPDVVVTTAACVDGLQAKNVLIKGGEWKLGVDEEPLPFQIVQVKTILRHPYYKRGSLLHDIAILVLTENLRLAKNIYPICLPRSGETLDAFYNGAGECIVTGWGKQVLQAHLLGSILHSVNVSLINPGECQAKLSQDYPHLLENYDQETCACGQPTNPVNNICKVDIGSALACTTGDGRFTLRGVYSWDSGCQPGNQLAAFYKFDLEWYEWAIGLIESARFAQYSSGSSVSSNQFSGQLSGGVKGGVKGASGFSTSGFGSGTKGGLGQFNTFGQGQFASSKFSESSSSEGSGLNFASQVKAPISSNSFSATYTEKKVFQSEPKIVTFTTKPEIYTFTTKPKIVTYTTKPQLITYETSGSNRNSQYVAPGVSVSASFKDAVGAHSHTSQCQCLKDQK